MVTRFPTTPEKHRSCHEPVKLSSPAPATTPSVGLPKLATASLAIGRGYCLEGALPFEAASPSLTVEDMFLGCATVLSRERTFDLSRGAPFDPLSH
jgi:hypothetical protein